MIHQLDKANKIDIHLNVSNFYDLVTDYSVFIFVINPGGKYRRRYVVRKFILKSLFNYFEADFMYVCI
jgi:hypothetical protein